MRVLDGEDFRDICDEYGQSGLWLRSLVSNTLSHVAPALYQSCISSSGEFQMMKAVAKSDEFKKQAVLWLMEKKR